MPAKAEPTPVLPNLSPVCGKPIIARFDGGKLSSDGGVLALRPARRPTGRELRGFLRRLVRAIRGHWPRVDILLRADSHYCAPGVLDFCRAERLDFIPGVATTRTLRRHVETLEHSTAARQAAGTDKLRRHKEFHDGAQRRMMLFFCPALASSWNQGSIASRPRPCSRAMPASVAGKFF